MIDPKITPDDNMSDEKLIEYSNHPNATFLQQNKARFILHKRKTRSDNRMLYMTAAILVLTIILVYAEFFHKSSIFPKRTITTDNVQSQQLNPAENTKEQHSKGDVTKIITHSSTSIKHK